MAVDDYIKGFVIGGLVGAVVGILYAPKSGKETREEISKSTEELLEKAKERYDEAREKLASLEKELHVEKK